MQEKEAGSLNPGNYLLQKAVQWSLVSAPDDRSPRQHATPDPGTEVQSYRGTVHISRQQWFLGLLHHLPLFFYQFMVLAPLQYL